MAERAGVDAHELAAQGFRVLAVVESVGDADRAWTLEGSMELLGLVAIEDPAKVSAAEVVRACHDAGIRTVLITGDHPATARAIADRVGITHGAGGVAVGEEVARGEHVDRVEEIGVYARTRPEQKVDIVAAWQAHGHVVAMTGDGVNDAPGPAPRRHRRGHGGPRDRGGPAGRRPGAGRRRPGARSWRRWGRGAGSTPTSGPSCATASPAAWPRSL